MTRTRLFAGTLVCAAFVLAPAPAMGAGWVYTQSNDPQSGQNSVLALSYANNGRLNPLHVREFPTRGTGVPLIPGESPGALAGDAQVLMSADKKWLFAVNGGSDSVAVFRVNRRTGDLRHVKGSPFRSGGNNPTSLGFNGRHLTVVNHGIEPPFHPGPNASFGEPNVTTFSVSSRTGRLRRIDSAPTGPAPTAALFASDRRTVIGTNFFGFAAPNDPSIQSWTVSSRGQISEAPGSPQGFPRSMYEGNPPLPPFLPPGIEKLAFGVGAHPTRRLAYVLGTVNFRVAVYNIGRDGRLTFDSQHDNPGGVAACWIAMTSDGRRMYTANTFTQDISQLNVSRSGDDVNFVEKTPLPSTATVFNLAVDEDDRFLYAVGGHADPDGPRPQEVNPDGTVGAPNPADGNFIEAYRIGRTGRLTSIGTTPLPVNFSTLPAGIATLERQRRP